MNTIWASQAANTFALRGEGITFSVEPDISGRPNVTISDRGSPELRYSGDEVTVEQVRVGAWYTVASPLESFQAESVSVLVPTVLLGPDDESGEVHTVGIRTTGPLGQGEIDGNHEDTVVGQRCSYSTLELSGRASLHHT